jgi:hypothetical protein
MENLENVVDTTTENVSNETNVTNENVAPIEKTFEEQIAELQEQENNAEEIYFAAKRERVLPQTELTKLKLASWKFTQQIERLEIEHKKQLDKQKTENERLERSKIFETFFAEFANVSDLNEEQKTNYDAIVNVLRNGIVKNILHVASGTTGEKLKKQTVANVSDNNDATNKKGFVEQLLRNNVPYDEMMKMTYPNGENVADGTIRHVAWQLGMNKNKQTGVYYFKNP